ncbi:MAG: glycogen synthase [Clostridia bacterium]|nr:glycogen synthase [Clostridia bacterium]
MKILYVASEAAPYAASGGLGDVMGSLPKEMHALTGDEVGVIMPLYSAVSPAYRKKMTLLTTFTFQYGWRNSYCGIYRLEEGGVSWFFVDNEQYFKRTSMYGAYDDGERYAYFCQAVIEFMLRLDYIPDVLHANDWQTALSVIYLKLNHFANEKLSHIKTVFTIHNIEYQGKYGMDILGDIFCIGYENADVLEYNGSINLLKGAVVCADKVTTVSPNYANELKDPYFAYGLSPIIRMFGPKMAGIINGLDTGYFNPEEKDIPFSYSLDTLAEGKKQNKAHLQASLGLPLTDAPLIVMITRLTEGKGVDLVLHVFEELMQENVQFVLLGTGDAKYEEAFSALASRYPEKARALIKFDRALSKEMYAAADIFLMPSKTEPCGLAQMIACRYGTIPVVHGVGGLADSIIPYTEEGGNGFVFRHFNAHDMLFRLKDAMALYENQEEWQALSRSAATSDFTWQASAKRYLTLYRQV